MKKGSSTNLEASALDRQTSRDKSSVLLRFPAHLLPVGPCGAQLSTPEWVIPLPAATAETNPGAGLPAGWAPRARAGGGWGSPALLGRQGLASLPPESFSASRPAEPGWGSRWRSLIGRVGGCPPPRKPLILCLLGRPGADRLERGLERGPGLLSAVDSDPGTYHLAFLCVF